MTNAQKYKTVDERVDAFAAFCEKQQTCEKCLTISRRCPGPECAFRWLALEVEEEKPLPCPFCGGEAHVIDCIDPYPCMYVQCSKCGVRTKRYNSRSEAVAAWNRRVK